MTNTQHWFPFFVVTTDYAISHIQDFPNCLFTL